MHRFVVDILGTRTALKHQTLVPSKRVCGASDYEYRPLLPIGSGDLCIRDMPLSRGLRSHHQLCQSNPLLLVVLDKHGLGALLVSSHRLAGLRTIDARKEQPIETGE
jgi:hypothetical protein